MAHLWILGVIGLLLFIAVWLLIDIRTQVKRQADASHRIAGALLEIKTIYHNRRGP